MKPCPNPPCIDPPGGPECYPPPCVPIDSEWYVIGLILSGIITAYLYGRKIRRR